MSPFCLNSKKKDFAIPRPICDVNGSEYQAILRGRERYRRYGMDYKDMAWAEDTLDRLEKKGAYGDYTDKDYADFLKAKEIHARVSAKASNGEISENRTTARYIWRTRGDGKVRPEHAANDGKIFAWDEPPSTGHPGQEFGCRCWAEPYKEGELQERSSQVVTYAAPDALPAWSGARFGAHYFLGGGTPVFLHEIGHLQNVINHARTYDQVDAGGGTLFERVENQIFKSARNIGEGSFSIHFNRSYSFGDLIWAVGGANVIGNGQGHVTEKGSFLIISADVKYYFNETFRDAPDIGNRIPDRDPLMVFTHFSDHRLRENPASVGIPG